MAKPIWVGFSENPLSPGLLKKAQMQGGERRAE
jgi:hypothetical protein